MFNESNSLSSTNLPDIIWLTSFGGTGEKPGATANDCCKTGTAVHLGCEHRCRKGEGLLRWHSLKEANPQTDLAEKWRPNWL